VAHQKSQQYKTYSKEDVQKFIKNGEWLKARHAAMAYRRNGGKDADKLLKAIDLKIEKVAADWFQKGSQAFRVEHIDQAVKDWSKAVSLQPENTEYVNALRRAKQLQEHLHLLRSDK
jgi:Tfp pilus assembly protein PilF